MALSYPEDFVERVCAAYDGPAADLARSNQFSLGAILCEGAAKSAEGRCLYTRWLRIVVSEAERIPASRRSWKPPVKASADVRSEEAAEVGRMRG